MDEIFSVEILEEFDSYFKKEQNNAIINIDRSLKKNFDLQVQRFEDAVKIFGGSIPPNRFSHFYIAILTSGQGVKSVGLTDFNVIPNSLIFIPSGTIHSSHSFTKNAKGFILSFRAEYLLVNYSNRNFLNELLFFQPENPPFLHLTEADKEILSGTFKNIVGEYLNYKDKKDDLLRLYILELLIKTERIYERQITQTGNLKAASGTFTKAFKQLLEKYFLQEKSVAFYARQLATHPNHLNATIKNATGKTCSEMIHDRILLEAKCLLQSTDLSIKEIAAYLSFEDSSYFSKYFKKLTGISPLKYKPNRNL
jgi:AraC family transcriptional regulator, transcriptional activator of pobA